MKIQITKAEHKAIVRGLFLASEWENSIASLNNIGTYQWRKYKRSAAYFETLKQKIFAMDNVPASPSRLVEFENAELGDEG